MSLNRADIENIARLARLELTEAEIPVYVDSLSRIFAFVGEVDRAPTTGIAPMAHPLPGLAQRLRPDAVTYKQHRAQQTFFLISYSVNCLKSGGGGAGGGLSGPGSLMLVP